jgi:NAD(P)-dependent dehydrogenase (short-subunit alcohol dehydrogenase family)
MVGAAMTVAVISGGGGDIGAAVGARLARDGVQPVLADVNLAAATRAAAGIPGAVAVSADVTDSDSVRALSETIEERFGRLDILVCSAGVEPPHDLASMTAAIWAATQAVNLHGPALLAQMALPFWRRQGSGAMVSIASRTWLGGPHPAYAASKAGLVGLTRSLAAELGPLGVTVNAVAPSFVRTAFSAQRGDPAALDAYAERVRALTPLGELVREQDVANAVAFLASDQAARITGEVLHVCAGSQLPVFVR